MDIYHRGTRNLNSHIHSSDVFSYILLEIPLSLAHERDNLVEGDRVSSSASVFQFSIARHDGRLARNVQHSYLISPIARKGIQIENGPIKE